MQPINDLQIIDYKKIINLLEYAEEAQRKKGGFSTVAIWKLLMLEIELGVPVKRGEFFKVSQALRSTNLLQDWIDTKLEGAFTPQKEIEIEYREHNEFVDNFGSNKYRQKGRIIQWEEAKK